jgi:hypothetical protein
MSSAIFERPSVPPTRLVLSQWWDRLAAFSRRVARNRTPITKPIGSGCRECKGNFHTASRRSHTNDATMVSQQIEQRENANKETNNS